MVFSNHSMDNLMDIVSESNENNIEFEENFVYELFYWKLFSEINFAMF